MASPWRDALSLVAKMRINVNKPVWNRFTGGQALHIAAVYNLVWFGLTWGHCFEEFNHLHSIRSGWSSRLRSQVPFLLFQFTLGGVPKAIYKSLAFGGKFSVLGWTSHWMRLVNWTAERRPIAPWQIIRVWYWLTSIKSWESGRVSVEGERKDSGVNGRTIIDLSHCNGPIAARVKRFFYIKSGNEP